jgi:hypothetical protein
LFGIHSPAIDGGSLQLEEFDLLKSPEDICIIIDLKSMFSGYESNVVKVPKEHIRQVLQVLK